MNYEMDGRVYRKNLKVKNRETIKISKISKNKRYN